MTLRVFPPRRPTARGERPAGGRRVRLGVSLALVSALIMSCGGNPAGTNTGQGAANLPPQTNPAVKDGDKDQKNKDVVTRTLSGTVLDALTGEPVAKATLYIEGVVSTVASTPIPAASPPGPAEGGGGGYQVAQAGPDEESSVVIEEDAASPESAATASPDPFASVDPFASPTPTASVAATPAAGATPGAGSPAPQPGQSSAPAAASTPLPAQEVKVDSKGKFELKDLPEGTYSITVWAPGYQAETFQGGLPTDLEVKLRPLDLPKAASHELKGVVRLANNQPATNVVVEASSMLGQIAGVRSTTDDAGSFVMDQLLPGNYAVAAWTTNTEGEISTFAMVKEVPVAVGSEKRTVSPTLVLRAVTTPLLLAGTVEGTVKEEEAKAAAAAKKPVDGVRPLSVRAFLRVNEGEIPVGATTVGKDGYFRLRLPALPEGASYHLVATGRSETGQTVYLHRYGVTQSDPKLTLQLPDGPGEVTVAELTKSPKFTWEGKNSEVSAYRVTIESIGDASDTIWQGWTTGTAIRLPSSKEFNLLKEGESYRVGLAAIKLDEDGKLNLGGLAAQPWIESALSRPATFEVQRLKPGQKPSAPAKAPLAVPAKPTATPKSDSRIKTLDEL